MVHLFRDAPRSPTTMAAGCERSQLYERAAICCSRSQSTVVVCPSSNLVAMKFGISWLLLLAAHRPGQPDKRLHTKRARLQPRSRLAQNSREDGAEGRHQIFLRSAQGPLLPNVV